MVSVHYKVRFKRCNEDRLYWFQLWREFDRIGPTVLSTWLLEDMNPVSKPWRTTNSDSPTNLRVQAGM